MNDSGIPCTVIPYEEIKEANLEVSQEDIIEYSHRLGIELRGNPALAALVRDWILQPLPQNWFPCRDVQSDNWFYFNALSGQSTWTHPLEEIHRALANDIRGSFGRIDPLDTERRTPEGESAEASMEGGTSAKGSANLFHTPSLNGSKNQLPRVLAPIKRSSAPLMPLKGNQLNPVPNAHSFETVRQVSFSTFKPNHSVPLVLNSPLTSSIDESVRRSTPESFRPASEQTRGSILGSVKSPSANDVAESCLKATPSLSFTERLAAKKASRIKLSETVADPVSEKKSVQFDLASKDVRIYTPEASEETEKVAERSESSSSDFLDFVCDPGQLKPFSASDDPRWDVAVTSFVTNDPSSPRDGRADNRTSNFEMLTSFNSNDELPKPSSASIFQDSSRLFSTAIDDSPREDPISIQPLAAAGSSFVVLEPPTNFRIESSPPKETADSSSTSASLALSTEDPLNNRSGFNEGIHHDPGSLSDPVSHHSKRGLLSINEQKAEQAPEGPSAAEETSSVIESIKDRSVPATRGEDQAPSTLFIGAAQSVDGEPVSLKNSPTEASPPQSLETAKRPQTARLSRRNSRRDSDNSSSAVESIAPSEKESSVAHRDPEPCRHDVMSSNSNEMEKNVTKAQRLEEDDWLRMKKEMESKLESERIRLEHMFADEMARMKRQFEDDLASERRLCAEFLDKEKCKASEDLARIVHQAHQEKEEILRMEHRFAQLVEEKRIQVETKESAAAVHPQVERQDAHVQTEVATSPVIERTAVNPGLTGETSSKEESQELPAPRMPKCQCDLLQRQVARVEKEMQLLKQRNLSFAPKKSASKKKGPVKAKREPWWMESDESSSASSISDWRPPLRGRSQSLTNLRAQLASEMSARKPTPVDRARSILSKSKMHKRDWLEDITTDHSSDTPTSGISSLVSTCEWDNVLSSIHKISGDLRQVWTHIGHRSRSASLYTPNDPPSWISSASLRNNVPLQWPVSGSTAQRTQALRQWLQHNQQSHFI